MLISNIEYYRYFLYCRSLEISARFRPENQEFLENDTNGRTGVTYKPSKRDTNASVFRPICETFGVTFLIGTIYKIIQDSLTFVNPQILR